MRAAILHEQSRYPAFMNIVILCLIDDSLLKEIDRSNLASCQHVFSRVFQDICHNKSFIATDPYMLILRFSLNPFLRSLRIDISRFYARYLYKSRAF